MRAPFLWMCTRVVFYMEQIHFTCFRTKFTVVHVNYVNSEFPMRLYMSFIWNEISSSRLFRKQYRSANKQLYFSISLWGCPTINKCFHHLFVVSMLHNVVDITRAEWKSALIWFTYWCQHMSPSPRKPSPLGYVNNIVLLKFIFVVTVRRQLRDQAPWTDSRTCAPVKKHNSRTGNIVDITSSQHHRYTASRSYFTTSTNPSTWSGWLERGGEDDAPSGSCAPSRTLPQHFLLGALL